MLRFKKTLLILLCITLITIFAGCSDEKPKLEKGTQTCDTCDGTGKIYCLHCNGKGVCQYDSCKLCSGYTNCQLCDGTCRHGECYDCDGSGERKATFRVYHNGKREFIYYSDD